MSVSIIIVSHNSAFYLKKLLPAIFTQTIPFQEVIVVESHPEADLSPFAEKYPIQVLYPKRKIGFAEANNLGCSLLKKNVDWILFCNPDIFFDPHFLQNALQEIASFDTNVGGFSPLLLGYDFHKEEPTGKIDSTGICTTWYGRFFDRHQGEKSSLVSLKKEKVLALCGALFFAKKEALESVALTPFEFFDSSFFMYKEDIDLSLRLKKKGWVLYFTPSFQAFHGRGWNLSRKKVPYEFRLISARNEWYIQRREKNYIGQIFFGLKYNLVKIFNL